MPTLSNQSGMQAALVPSIDCRGHNIMVALVKGTWKLSARAPLELVHDAVPVQIADVPLTLMREREHNALRLPSDLCEAKPQVDVIVIAPEMAEHRRAMNGRRIGIAVDSFRFMKTTADPWPLGPLSRTDKTRLQYAGTYDDAWRRSRMPLLPADFDLRYHQAAPADQVIAREHLSGDEAFSVTGLHDTLDRQALRLPGKAVLVTGHIGKDYFSRLAALDTVQLWTDHAWLTLVWRLVIRPRQKIEEIGNVVVHAIRTQTARELYGLA